MWGFWCSLMKIVQYFQELSEIENICSMITLTKQSAHPEQASWIWGIFLLPNLSAGYCRSYTNLVNSGWYLHEPHIGHAAKSELSLNKVHPVLLYERLTTFYQCIHCQYSIIHVAFEGLWTSDCNCCEKLETQYIG
jgi:hypothetical protein